MDGLVRTSMNARLTHTLAVFMHPAITPLAPTCAVAWKDSKAMDGLVRTSTNARLTHSIAVSLHPAITLSALTVVSVTKDSWGMDDPVMILMSAATEVIFATLTPDV